MEKLFEAIFNESRVIANRHLDVSEKDAVVEYIKECVYANKYKVVQRNETLGFLRWLRLDANQAAREIADALEAKNVMAVIENRNYPRQGSKELYLIRMYLRNKPTYVKVDIDQPYITFISIHLLKSYPYVDYQYAKDGSENNLPKMYVKEWVKNYRKSKPQYQIKNYFVNGNTVHFDFYEQMTMAFSKEILPDLWKVRPKHLYDFATKAHNRNELEIEIAGGGIEITLAEKD